MRHRYMYIHLEKCCHSIYLKRSKPIIVLGLWQIPIQFVSPGNQPSPLLRQVVLVGLNAHPAQIQSVIYEGSRCLQLVACGLRLEACCLSLESIYEKFRNL